MAGTPRKALVIGGINLDIQCKSYAPFLARDSNPGKTVWAAGGVGRNIAENLVRLGVRTELLTVFGEESSADFLRDSCERNTIRTDRSLVLKDRRSSQYLCILDSDGSLVGAVADMDIFEELSADRLGGQCRARAAMAEADIVVVDANLPAESIEWITRNAGGKPLLLDPVSRTKAARAVSCIGGFSFVKPNREEAAVLSGHDTRTDAGLWAAAECLCRKGVREVCISLGVRGLLYYGSTGRGFVRPPAVQPVNLSGAGDAAAAALAWATLEDLPLREKARLAVGASVLASLSEATVSCSMNRAELETICKGVICEPVP